MGDPDRNQPRQLRNLTGLLRFCAENTADEDTTTTSQYEEMDEERKQWLSSALQEITRSPVDRLKECVGLILQSGESEEEQEAVESVLDEITETCEEIDLAKDFYKIGGYQIFHGLLKSENPELRWRTLNLIATLVQNNPFCQTTVLEAGLLPTILGMLDVDASDQVKIKALYAVSCLLRDMPDAQKQFEDCDGFSKLMRAMQSDVEKMKVKATFLLSSLCSQQPAFKDTLCDMGMVDQLVGQLGEDHSSWHEHLMSALLALVTDHDRARRETQREQLQFCKFLKQRIEHLQGKDEYQEERSYAEALLKICFSDDKDSDLRTEACR